MEEEVRDRLHALSREAAELGPYDVVIEHNGEPDPLWFYREHVSRGIPCIFRGAAQHWPAISKWTNDYLRQMVGDTVVSVAVTPNGYADAVREDLNQFVMPHEKRMPISHLLDVLEKREEFSGIHYLQRQNSNFTEDFSQLWKDTELEVSWASKAFGSQPDAVNLWIGDERAVTSLHKDHYENMYCVVRGEKHFILLPPTDRPVIPHAMYDSARYHLDDDTATSSFTVVADSDHGVVPWIPLDPQRPDLHRWPEYRHAHPVRCTLRAGDMLYLPSIWFHHVSQSHSTIAVNFWYDMAFDVRYAYFQCIEGLANMISSPAAKNDTKQEKEDGSETSAT